MTLHIVSDAKWGNLFLGFIPDALQVGEAERSLTTDRQVGAARSMLATNSHIQHGPAHVPGRPHQRTVLPSAIACPFHRSLMHAGASANSCLQGRMS